MSKPFSEHIELGIQRLDWALGYINRFDIERRAFLDSNPYKPVHDIKLNSQGQEVVLVSVQTVIPVPSSLRFLAADAIHNLRASVNNILWGLWIKFGGKKNFSLEFSTSDLQFGERYGEKLSILPKEVGIWIRNQQDYARPDEKRSPLSTINTLWNEDKHRLPLLFGFLAETLSFGVLVGGKFTASSIDQVGDGRAFEDGKVVLKATISSALGTAKYFNANFTLDIAFKKGDCTAVETLRRSHGYIRDEVIPYLEPFFK